MEPKAPKPNKTVGYQPQPGKAQAAPVPPARKQSTASSFLDDAEANSAGAAPFNPYGDTGASSTLQATAGDSKYDEGLVAGMDANLHRANKQGVMAEIGARAVRLLPDIAMGVGEQLGYIGDLENVAGVVGAADTDFDNWLSKAMRAGTEGLAEAVPVYQKDPGATLSLSDSATWVNQGANLLESLGAFYLTGAGLGGVASAGVNALMETKAAAGLLAKSIQAAKTAEGVVGAVEGAAALKNGLMTGAQFATSSLLAYTGGVMQAQNSYRSIYEQGIKNGRSEEQSRKAASEAAADIVRWTTASTSLLNITSLGPIFRPFKQELAYADELGAAALGAKAEGRIASSLAAGELSAEAAATQRAGAGLSTASLLDELKLLRANPTRLANTEGLFKKMFKPESLGWEMGQEAVEEFAENAAQVRGENTGKESLGLKADGSYFDKDAMLAAALGAVGGAMGAGIMKGIDKVNGNDAREQSDFVKAIDLRIDSMEKFKTSREALDTAIKNKDSLATMLHKNELFSQNVFHAIQSDTDDYLKASYDDIVNMSEEAAKAAGYDVDVDSPTHYKKTAEQAVAHLETSKRIYDSVLNDINLPSDLKVAAIQNLVGMDMLQRQEDSLGKSIDTLYSKERQYEPHIMQAKRLTNQLTALDLAEAYINKQTTQITNGPQAKAQSERLVEIHSAREAIKGQLETFKQSLTPDQQQGINNLPVLSSDPVIMGKEVERTIAKAQQERMGRSVKDLYNPAKQKAHIEKLNQNRMNKSVAESVNKKLDEFSKEFKDGIERVDPTAAKLANGASATKISPLTINEMAQRISSAEDMLKALPEDADERPALVKRIEGMKELQKRNKNSEQEKNRREADVKFKREQRIRGDKMAESIAARVRAERQKREDDKEDLLEEFDAIYRSPVETVHDAPINELLTNQRASKIRGPHPASMNDVNGLVDLNDNNQPVFIDEAGNETALNPKKSNSSQGLTIYEAVVAPQVVNIRTIEGQKLGFEIAGEMYTIGTINPADALEFDNTPFQTQGSLNEDGTRTPTSEPANLLKSVTLVNAKGENVVITDENIMYDIADPIMLYQQLMDVWLEDASTMTDSGEIAYEMELDGRSYFVVYDHRDPMSSKILTKNGKELLVAMKSYRGKDGELTRKGVIMDALVESFHKDVLSRVMQSAWKRIEDNRATDVEEELYFKEQEANGFNEAPFEEGDLPDRASLKDYSDVSPTDTQLPGEASPAIPQNATAQPSVNDAQAAGAIPVQATAGTQQQSVDNADPLGLGIPGARQVSREEMMAEAAEITGSAKPASIPQVKSVTAPTMEELDARADVWDELRFDTLSKDPELDKLSDLLYGIVNQKLARPDLKAAYDGLPQEWRDVIDSLISFDADYTAIQKLHSAAESTVDKQQAAKPNLEFSQTILDFIDALRVADLAILKANGGVEVEVEGDGYLRMPDGVMYTADTITVIRSDEETELAQAAVPTTAAKPVSAMSEVEKSKSLDNIFTEYEAGKSQPTAKVQSGAAVDILQSALVMYPNGDTRLRDLIARLVKNPSDNDAQIEAEGALRTFAGATDPAIAGLLKALERANPLLPMTSITMSPIEAPEYVPSTPAKPAEVRGQVVAAQAVAAKQAALPAPDQGAKFNLVVEPTSKMSREDRLLAQAEARRGGTMEDADADFESQMQERIRERAEETRQQNTIDAQIDARQQAAIDNKIAADKAKQEAERAAKNKANKPTALPQTIWGTDYSFTTKNFGNGKLALVFSADGLPVRQNENENINPAGLANPDFNVGSQVTYELGTNLWWDTRKLQVKAEDVWKEQPIYVVHNGRRVAKLESDSPLRRAIHQGLMEGRTVGATVEQKRDSNLINLVNPTSRPNLRPVSVMSGKWQNGEFVPSPVMLTVAVGMTPDGDENGSFVPMGEGYVGLDKGLLSGFEGVEENLLDNGSNKGDGHVYAVIQTPGGKYMPYKLSTQNLNSPAIEKIIELLESGDVNEIDKLVYAHTPDDQAEAPSRKFFAITPGKDGYIIKYQSSQAYGGKGGIVLIDLKIAQEALAAGGKVMVRGSRLESDGQFQNLVSDKTLHSVDLKSDLMGLLATKKFHVDKNLLNGQLRFESPLSGKTYNSYLDYLSSTEEVNGSAVLRTDSWGDGYPDGSAAGVFHFNVGVSFNNISIGEKTTPARFEVAPTSAQTVVAAAQAAPYVVPETNIFGEADFAATSSDGKYTTSINLDDLEDEPFRLGEDTGVVRDMEGAKTWLSERDFPPTIHSYMRMIGSKVAHGSFKAGLVMLWDGSEVGTEYHEGFHAVLRTFVSPADMKRLLDEGRARYGMQEASDLEVEERLAEDFKHYMLTGIKPKDVRVRNLFQKLWDAIKAYLSNPLTIDRLFEQIEGNTFDRSVKNSLSKREQEVFSAKGNVTAKTLAEVTDAIASYVINDREQNVNKKLEVVRGEFIRRIFVDKTTDLPPNLEVGKALYEQYIKPGGQVNLPAPYAFGPRFKQMLQITKGWYDVRDGGEYNNPVEKGWQSLALERMKYYGFRVSGDLNLVEGLEENLQEDKIFNKASVESSVKDTLTAGVRSFLMQVPQLDVEGKPMLNLIGNPTFVPFDTEVYPVLQRLLANSRTIAEMEERIISASNVRPWLKYVSDALRSGHGRTKGKAHIFRNQFFPALAMIEKNFSFLKIEELGDKKSKTVRMQVVDSNSANVNNSTRKYWQSQAYLPVSAGGSGLFTKNDESGYDVDKNKAAQVRNLVSALQVVTPATDLASPEGVTAIANYAALLNHLGAAVRTEDVTKWLTDGDVPNQSREQLSGASLLHYTVNNNLKRKDNTPGLATIATALDKNTDPYDSEANVMRRLTQGVGKYLISPTLSFVGGGGRSVYPINLPTALDELMNNYVNNPGYSTRLEKDSFYFPERDGINADKSSVYASPFAYALANNAANFKSVFRKETLDVLKDQTKGSTDNTEYGDLYYGKELTTRLGYFLSSGKEVMRIAMATYSDRGKMDFLTVPRVSYLSSDKVKHQYGMNPKEIMLGYVLQDISRAQRAKKDFDKAQKRHAAGNPRAYEGLIANYHYSKKYNVPGRAMQFTQWDFLQTLEDPKYPGSNAAKELMRIALDDENSFTSTWEEKNALRDDVFDYIEKFMADEVRALKDAMTKYKVEAGGLDFSRYGGSVDVALKDFVLADTITRNEAAKLFAGDYAFYKSHENFSKRYGILESPGYKSSERVGNKDVGSEGRKYGDHATFHMAVVNDFFTTKESLGFVESMSKYLDEGTLSDYRDGSNKSDAMGVTTIHKHRAKLMGFGTWTDNHERAYVNYTGKKSSYLKDTTPDAELFEEFGFRSEKGKMEYPPLTPLKTLTDAFVMNNERMERIIIKHSTFPLLKGITRMMPGLDSLREHMEQSAATAAQDKSKYQIDVVNMVTALKAVIRGNIDMTPGEDGRFTNLDMLTSISIPSVYERVPQIVPDVQANDPLWGSQAKKMVPTNLVPDGVYTFANGKTLTGTNLFAAYNKVGASMMQKSLAEMYANLDYTKASMSDAGARKAFFIKLQTNLVNGIDSKDLSDNYLKGLQLVTVNGKADFRVPLALPAVARKFEQMLLSPFRKEVMQQRVHGMAMVQIAELGGHIIQNGDNAKGHDALKFVSLGKDANGKDIIDHAEVAIPFKLAEKMGLKPGPNGEYDLQAKDAKGNYLVDQELLSLIAYRIPTQGKNSMLPMKIVRVLPPNVKAIMVPGFITKQMGSDFDVDKLFLMQKNYEEVYNVGGKTINKLRELQGSLAKLKYQLTSREIKQLLTGGDEAFDELEVTNPTMGDKETFMQNFKSLLTKLEDKIGDTKPTIKKVAYDMDVNKNLDKDDYRERLENYLIDMTESILRSPLHVNEMMKSVDSPTLPKLAVEAREIDARKALKLKGIDNPTAAQIKQADSLSAQGIMTELVLAQRNKTGGAGIGMYATAGTGHAIGQFMKSGKRKLELSKDYAVRIGKETITDLTATKGPASLGSHDISTGYNERLNAAVDNANEPVMSFINDNSFTYPVINLFVRAGTGNEIATYLCRQPVIMELTEYFLNEEMTPDQLMEAANEIGKRYKSSYSAGDTKSTTPMSVDSLKKGMLAGGNELDVLNNFVLYHKAGRMLSKVNKICNSDRVGDMSSLSGIEEYQDVQDEITNSTRNRIIQNTDIVTDIVTPAYGIVGEYQKVIKEAENFASNFLPYTNPGMKAIKNTLRTALNKSSLKQDVLNAVNSDAALYMFTRTGSPFKGLLMNIDASVNDLLNGPNSVIYRLGVIKEKHKKLANAGKPSADKLLNRLAASDSNIKQGNRVNTLQFSSSYAMSQYEQNEIIDAFLQLANSKDEVDQQFARDLVKYTLLTTGFNASKDSLLEYVPMEYWTDERFYIGKTTGKQNQTMAEFFRANPINLSASEQADFVEKFIRNNYHLKGMLPTVYKYEGTTIVGEKTRKFYNAEMADQSMTQGWVQFVGAYDKANKQNVLFEFDGLNDAGLGIYTMKPTHGIPYQLKNYSGQPLGYQKIAAGTATFGNPNALMSPGITSVPSQTTPNVKSAEVLKNESGNTYRPDAKGKCE